MSTQRFYTYANIFNARMVMMKYLWEPSTEYQGKKQEKPSYMAGVIVPKTRAAWHEEPALSDFTRACGEHYQRAPHLTGWPVKDGDIAEPGKGLVEWMRGHWYISGNSSSPISVEVVQNGAPVKVQNRTIVKPGDYVSCGYALAVKTNDPRSVKAFLNTVLFTAPGEEIAIGNSVTGTELMAQAKAQGLNVTGFGSGPGGFSQQGGQSFGQQQYQAPAPLQPAPGGFGGQPQPGFQQPSGPAGGFAPQGATGGFAGAQTQSGFGAAPSHSNGGFAPPQGFQPPQGGFPG